MRVCIIDIREWLGKFDTTLETKGPRVPAKHEPLSAADDWWLNLRRRKAPADASKLRT